MLELWQGIHNPIELQPPPEKPDLCQEILRQDQPELTLVTLIVLTRSSTEIIITQIRHTDSPTPSFKSLLSLIL